MKKLSPVTAKKQNKKKKTRNFTNLYLKVDVIYEWRSRLDWSTYIPKDFLCSSMNAIHRQIKGITQISRKQAKFNNLTWRSMPFKGQCQIQFKRLEGVVTNVILFKYEDIPLDSNKVIANNSKIQAYYTINWFIQRTKLLIWMIQPWHANDIHTSSL